jgi:hypothetical protein
MGCLIRPGVEDELWDVSCRRTFIVYTVLGFARLFN